MKSARRSPSTTCAPVRRAMWPCSWYVGSNVATDPARPGVGEQQRLQHLVRPVGGEHLVRPDAVQRGDGGAQLGGRSGPDSGATRRATARRRRRRCHAAGGAVGDSLVLSRTRTDDLRRVVSLEQARGRRGQVRGSTCAGYRRVAMCRERISCCTEPDAGGSESGRCPSDCSS